MRALAGVLLVVVLALGVSAAARGLGDRSTLASPPEAVIEDFVRKLATGRYDRAREDLSEDLAREVKEDSLQALVRGLEERVGSINDVQGVRLWMTPGSARAGALLETELAGQVWLELPLEWQDGDWAVADLHGLAAEREPPDTTAM